jgi:hypothetical protein
MNNQWMISWTSLDIENAVDRVFVMGECSETVHSFGGHADDASLKENLSS